MVDQRKQSLIELGKEIGRIRRSRGVSIDRLANEMGISKGNLSDIEHAKRDPRYTTLKKIAEGLNMSISALLKKL